MRFNTLLFAQFLMLFVLFSCADESKEDKKNQVEKQSTEKSNTKEESTNQQELVNTAHSSTHLIKFKVEQPVDDFLVKFNELMNANPGMLVTNTFDHQENAKSSHLTMDFSTFHHLYTNQLVNPLVAENPLTALDLPMRIHFYEEDGEDLVQFIDGNYLIKRYNLNSSIETASSNSRVLNSITQSLSNNEAFTSADLNFKKFEGIDIYQSTSNFNQTAKSILGNIKKKSDVSLLAAHDFQSFAEDAGFEMGKCILLLFGNPKVGTSLMKEKPSLGIDLPLKLLIYEDGDGSTKVASNDMNFIFGLHGYQNRELAEQMNQLAKSLITGN